MTRRMADPMTQAAQMPEWMQERLGGTVVAPGEIELAPDEVQPFALFLSLATQWRWCPISGQRLGIDYGAIQTTAAMMDVAVTPALFTDLRRMEAAALDALAEGRRP